MIYTPTVWYNPIRAHTLYHIWFIHPLLLLYGLQSYHSWYMYYTWFIHVHTPLLGLQLSHHSWYYTWFIHTPLFGLQSYHSWYYKWFIHTPSYMGYNPSIVDTTYDQYTSHSLVYLLSPLLSHWWVIGTSKMSRDYLQSLIHPGFRLASTESIQNGWDS